MSKDKNKWGFIALWRKTREHWLWEKKRPRTKFEAWVDLLWLASHQDTKKLVNEQLVILKTGQRDLSYRFLRTRWLWSKDKVVRFIKMLENDEMISTDTSTGQTIVTICNYETYQLRRNQTSTDSSTPTSTLTSTPTSTQARHRQAQREPFKTINNNYKQFKKKEENDFFQNGINQSDEAYDESDHKWALMVWGSVHERFNLHHDSFNGYLGHIIDCYKRIGKDKVEFGIKNFIKDNKTSIKDFTYFFRTGIDKYLLTKDRKKGKNFESQLDRMKQLL